MNPILKFCLHSSVNQTCPLDVVTYTVEITNISHFQIDDLIVKDLLPSELKFILSSVKIDYVSDFSSNIISGVNLGSLKPCESKTLSFEAEVLRYSCNPVQNQALAEFTYFINHKPHFETDSSNVSILLIKNPSLKVVASADNTVAELGDIINFTLRIVNDGNLDLENLLLKTNISKSLELIDGSFKIDRNVIHSVELEKGVFIQDLPMDKIIYVEYATKVISDGVASKLINTSHIKYGYSLPNKLRLYKESESTTVCVDMAISNFRQISVEQYLDIPEGKPDMECINSARGSLKINKYSIIKTPTATSSGGQMLSGYKLVVHGEFSILIEYVADDMDQSLHTAYYRMPFSDYIVLPYDFTNGSKLSAEGIVEDISFKEINSRCFFNNISVLLIAKIASCK